MRYVFETALTLLLLLGIGALTGVGPFGVATAYAEDAGIVQEDSDGDDSVDLNILDDDDTVVIQPFSEYERGRKDAREVLLPQPTYGNSSPFPFCSAGSAICP